MANVQEIIKKNLVTYRKQLGLTQAKLAEKAGICTTYIGEMETCRKYPSIKTLEKIAAVLKVEPYVLLMDPELNKNDVIIRYNNRLKDEFSEMVDKFEAFK